MSDLVSRQEVKEILRTEWVKLFPMELDPYLSLAIAKIENIPSAEPVIIRCKDCKYWHREIHNDIEYFNFSSCDLNHYGDGHNFYCADAERRTDE